ncbi:uncharacterized protein LOC111643396 [Copidosoma floridanum]|uniref:uncharacterized protein LOC111643396 n=1 Tax=Copidosoma floridanum TaxID=29053 RepID=UPI000C6F6D2F|nr:uncharacterized protein LOC111643396 [Copidosoma floridanum]
MAVEYSRFMADYLAMGHMRPFTSAELAITAGPVNYIHHHGIWQHDDRGRKLRVVFNASNPTSSGHSLNDVLHAGPRLQAALPSVLMRWRRHRIAFCSDIRMMFRQIWIDYRDVDLQRIVWAADPSQPPTHYQLLTVTYGESCSPYLSLRTLQQLCQDEGHNWPEAVSAALCDRYADDFLSGADDVTAARRLRDQLSGLMKAGGFPLRKWVANVRELLDDLPDDVRLRPTWEQLSAEGLVSELGVKWDPPSDCFQLTPPPLQPQSTKRTMLAALAGLFDPCGWLAPIVLNAKLLLQDLWRARLGWDEPAPISMTRRWAEFTAELQAISTFTLPRWIGVGPSSELHLHGFSDASRRAMAAVIYSRLAPGAGPALCHILLARTKLSPIRSLKPAPETSARMTIPRLELRAALIAAKLLRTAADELRVPVDRCHAWCDSQIVLHWLRSDRPTNNVLIDNYVAQIQEMLPSSVWRYVPTQSNPADLATRGADMTGLRSQRTWWEGPAWLAEDVDSWPLDPLPAPNQHSSICCVVQQLDASYLEQFSNLRMLLSFLVRIRRFVRSRLGRGPVLSVASPLTPTELHDAFLACVRLSQERSFSDDLQCLRRGERLRKTNPLVPLAAFLDDDGILRVGGRLEHSPLTYEERHPPILSGASSLASMVIAWAHSRALHGGYRVTSAYVCKRAWLLGGPRRIKAHLRRCVVCIRLRARPATQLMAPLPSSRVSPSRAFACTGVDYAGPFHVLSARGRGVRTTKGYIAVFVCLATKALHLELVGDLSAASFLGALHRFAGRRGRPGEIWSDNATCFRRADVELRDALLTAELDWGLVAGSLADQGIAWKFIPPGAPHFGGLWEAAVKSTKSHLQRVMGSRHLTYEEFSTVLVGIEMVLNSRPLTPLSGDTGDLDILTPGHFLVGGPLNSIVLPGPPAESLDALAHWELVRGVRAQFWSRWSREYLNTLQQRSKWTTPRRNFIVGDVVVLLDATLLQSSGRWPIGRVISVHPGADGFVRAATLKTATGVYKRSITKMVLLPVSAPPAAPPPPEDSLTDPGLAGGT